MALLTLTDARTHMLNGKPWTFRLEFHGQTSNGNPSHKFWLATGRARNEPVEIHYGGVACAHAIERAVADVMAKEGLCERVRRS